MGKCSNHTVFSCETFVRVYINHTLIKNLKNENGQAPVKFTTQGTRLTKRDLIVGLENACLPPTPQGHISTGLYQHILSGFREKLTRHTRSQNTEDIEQASRPASDVADNENFKLWPPRGTP